MRRIQIDGAWEGDALPAGQFCAALPDGRIQTHAGIWQAPEWLRFPRISPASGFVCGTRQNTVGVATEVRPDGWADVGQICGNRAVLYRASGELLRNTDCNAPPYYGQGYRYEDGAGKVYSAAETGYRVDWNIHAWTEREGIIIGQGHESGCHLIYQGKRYLLEPGATEEITFTRAGDQLAVSMIRRDIAAVVVHWLTVADIQTLIEITDPVDPPDPPDPPDPEPDVDFPRSLWDAVVVPMHVKYAEQFPTNDDGARGFTKMLNEQLAFSDPSGGWCWKSSSPTNPPSKDVSARQFAGRFEGWDMLSAAGVNGPRVLAIYPPAYHDLAGQHPIAVTPQNHLGDDPPDPPDPPSDDLEARVEQLEKQQAALIAANAAQDQRIKALEQQAPPSNGMTPAQVVALIDAAFASADISGRTQTAGGFLSHSHAVSGLSIVRKP